jgi:hypothetical protein
MMARKHVREGVIRSVRRLSGALATALGAAVVLAAGPDIPRTWVDADVRALEVPLVDAGASPQHVSADYYYRIPARRIFRSYPVYAPGRGPQGYFASLKKKAPAVAFDAHHLHTEADWIRAGELVFDAPIAFDEQIGLVSLADIQSPEWYTATGWPVLPDGTIPGMQYVIRERGKIELAQFSCGFCHTRVMPDGHVIKGAQGNTPNERAFAYAIRHHYTPEINRQSERFLSAMPWRQPDLQANLNATSSEEIARWHEIDPPGVIARHRASVWYPTQVPDLIGVEHRRYLDHTGLQPHHSIVDVMRYAALNQGADNLASFSGFIPAADDFKTLPTPETQSRYGDDQLYALGKYLYSLKPPANPNRFDTVSARGQSVFQRERCSTCHTPPLYTNNKLTPALGFTIPEEHRTRYDIHPVSVGTDPHLTMDTRRGTGYYKVPSLLGVWYRGPFEHSGSVATLEDWFDPHRLDASYVPTGFKGIGMVHRAVKGHPFGLTLSPDDKRALIAFLRTL